MGKIAKVIIFSLLCLIWSSTWLMIKVGLNGAPPLLGAGLRFSLASLIILAILIIKKIPLPMTKHFFAISIFLGFAQMGIPYGLVYWGEQHVSSGLAALLFSTMPFAVAVLARMILGDPLTLPKISGIILGTVGVAVIFSDNLSLQGSAVALGMLAMIGSAFLASLSSVIVKKYSFKFNPLASIFLPITIGALLLLAGSFIVERDHFSALDPLTIGTIFYLAILGTVGAFSLYYWIIKHIDVTFLSYQTFIIPVLACLLGWIILGETIDIRILIGGALILVGIVLAVGRKQARLEVGR